MGRRLLTALVLTALAAAGWWIVRSSTTQEDGSSLTVLVEVVDAEGEPLPQAQVERVFEQQRLRVNSEGRIELTHVVLRELDRPSPEALRRAVRVYAPFHALDAGAEPEITRRGDVWRMRWRLTPHGVLRLYVAETHLGPCKAFPEIRDDPRLQPMGSRHVARHGSPASFRVFAGIPEIVVRIEGEANREGVIGVATRKLSIEPPASGYVVERVLTPEEVQVIVGQVTVGDGPTPPSLGGIATITQVDEGRGGFLLARVRVPEDGRFVARRTGRGPYEIDFELDFFPGTTTTTVSGGDAITIEPAQPATWATVEHPDLDLRKRAVHTWIHASGVKKGIQPPILGGNGVSHVPLPGPGRHRIRIDVYGTNALPPQHLRLTADVARGVADTADLRIDPLPHGTLVVHVAADVFGKARGATVRLELEHDVVRSATLIPGLAESVTFKHVVVGSHGARIDWEEEGRAATEDWVEVEAGETTTWMIETQVR